MRAGQTGIELACWLELVLFGLAWGLLIEAAALGAALPGIHIWPRRTPKVVGMGLALAALVLGALLIYQERAGLWPLHLLVALPIGLLGNVLLSALVKRNPEALFRPVSPTEGPPACFRSRALSLEGHDDAGLLFLTPEPDRTESPLLLTPEPDRTESHPDLVVVLVHGAGNDRLHGLWYLVDTMIGRGAKVLTAHLPGHGKGGSDHFSLASARARLDGIVALARELAPGGRVVLCGQSMGGSLALDLALRGGPVDCIVAMSAPVALRLGIQMAREFAGLFRPAIYRTLAYGNPWEVLPAAGRFKRGAFPIRVANNRPYETIIAMLAELALPRRLVAARETLCPILLAHGASDGVIQVSQARELAHALGPGATLKIYSGVGHLDPLFNTRVVTDLLAWMERADGDGAGTGKVIKE